MLEHQKWVATYRKPSFGNALLIALCVSALWMVAADAQQTDRGAAAPALETPAITADTLQARIKALEGQQDIPPELKAKLVELLNQGVAAAGQADALKIEFERLAEQLRRAPDRQAEIAQALSRSAPTFDQELLIAQTPAAEADTKLRESEAALGTARQRVQTLNAALARQRQRPEAIQASLAEARGRLAQVEEELKTPPVPDEPAALGEARTLTLGARRQMRTLELAALEQELGGHDLLLALLRAELELAEREVASLEEASGAWQAVVQRLRERQAAAKTEEAEAAERALTAMPEAVRTLAERNTDLAEELRELTKRETKITDRLTATDARLKEIAEDLTAVQDRVELAGLNDTIALVLRKQRDALPTMGSYRALAREVRAETNRASGRQLDHVEVARDLADPSKASQRFVDSLDPSMIKGRKALIGDRVGGLLRKQRELAVELREGYGRYLKQLGRLENAERTLVARAEDFNRLIDEHLLWIRSTPPVSLGTIAKVTSGLGWLADPSRWPMVIGDLRRSLWQAPLPWLFGMVALAVALALRARAMREIEEAAIGVGNVASDSFSLTARTLLATLIIAAAWPLIAVVLGWPLLSSIGGDMFSRAVGGGLLAVALIGFGISLLRLLCRDGGLGDAHFGWPAVARHELRRHVRWIAYIALPLGFVIWAVETFDDETIRASLGRVAFVLAMLALVVFIVRVLRPHGALLNAVAERHGRGIVAKLRYLWMPVSATAPLSLAVLSLFGYHYSAVQLQNRLQATAWIVITLVLVNESLMRWLVVTHRRLAHQRAVEEQEEARREQIQRETSEADGEDVVEFEEPEIDLDAIQAQTGSLIRTIMGIIAIIGIWVTWSSVLPALGVLDEITLWRYPEKLEGVERLVPVTLVDFGLALLVTALAYLATKNLPGALELAVLNRTSLDAGAKYAFITLCRYAIAGVGIVLVFNYLGMDWSRLQWLVAALSVGLGFGLQEIVANFISGLILLFERPIRVGDIVTIDGASGTVSRIRIRATTITDWDRKELIVPNKRFITGEVLNWTLSNELNRIVVNVGVAYGSDTERARELLLEVARQHPRILQDPAPVASFEGFGDNTLNLVLRCYMPNLDGRIGVITELHSAIDSAFKEAGIEIAFPQRDIHIDAAVPLEVRVLSERARGRHSQGSVEAGSS